MKITGGQVLVAESKEQGATAIVSTPNNRIITYEHPVEVVDVDPPFMILLQTQAATGSSDIVRFDFTGLTGDTDGIYHIEFFIKTAINADILLELNDDGAGISRRHTVASTELAYGSTMVVTDASAIGNHVEGRFVMNAQKTLSGDAKSRRYRVHTAWQVSTGPSVFARVYAGTWANSADEVTKISFVGAGDVAAISSGSWARLYRYAT